MPENLTPSFQVVPDENISADTTDRTTPWLEQQVAGYRLSGPSQVIGRTLIQTFSKNDPKFDVWTQIEKDRNWQWVGDLAEAQSKEEYDRLITMRDINLRDKASWEGGRYGALGLLDTLMVEALNPVNYVPVPLSKGIGIFKGGAIGAGTAAVTSGVEEALRIQADPTSGADEWLSSVALSTLLGAGIGGAAGGWGAGAVRRQRAIREYELGLSDIDSPHFSLKPRGSEDFELKYERGPRNPDGTYSTFKVADEVRGYAVKTLDGVRYTSEDGSTWVRADEVGRAEPLSVSDDIAETLDVPEPVMRKVAYIDEAAHKNEHLKAQWHDEIAGYLPEQDMTPIERVVLDGNDFSNFRTYHDLWKMRLPQLASETADEWQVRTGREAMREFRASKASGDYAGGVIGKLMQRLNFSPIVKAINTFSGDNRVAELAIGIGGDYGFATVGAKHGWSAPPSLLLKSIRHVPRLKQFNDAFEAEWLKYASANQQAVGRQFQSMNVSAAGYALKDGLRRFAGAQVLTKSDFEEMVAEAVFNKNEFSVNGFPVNENARAAAKAFTQLAQEYDEMHRAAGNFRDQKTLTRDIKHWNRQKIHYEERMMKWLFGSTGQPSSYNTSIKVQTAAGEKIFTAESYDAAIQKMLDELGDEGIALSENLERGNYGWDPIERAAMARDPMTDPELDQAWEEEFVEIDEPRNLGLFYDETLANVATAGEALDIIKAQGFYTDLIDLIRGENEGVPLNIIDEDSWGADVDPELFLGKNVGGYHPGLHNIMVRGKGWLASGANPETIVHEAVHVASSRRLLMAKTHRDAGIASGYTDALDELESILSLFNKAVDDKQLQPLINSLTDVQLATLRTGYTETNRSIQEMMAWGLTNPQVREALRMIPAEQPKGFIRTQWDKFVAAIYKLLGKDNPTQAEFTALDRLLSLQDIMLDLKQPRHTRELQQGRVDPGAPRWVPMDEMIEQRERSLTPRQKTIYADFKKAADDADANIKEMTEQLKLVTDTPHQFLDANGNAEPWYHRSWDKAKAATEQEKLIRLITGWYARDNPDGARARATETLKNILAEDAEITGQGTMSALKQRMLNMPNSWSIEDPEFGTIKVSDYIDKRILSVAEHYVKRSAVQIEAAKMYGDSQLKAEKIRLRQYLTETYLANATSDREIRRIKAKIDEAVGEIDITFRSVAGTIRTTDPLRMDNRIARTMRDFTHLTLMGKVAWNSLSEIMRPGMVNGFGTFYHSLFSRYLDDLEEARGNIEFNGLTGELFEMSMAHNHVQAVTIQDGEPVLGGTAMERWISNRVPGLFKISGLTGITTWMKGINGYASQHVVMDMAQQVGKAILAGQKPNPDFAFRLQAVGIGPREAILLAGMPVNIKQGGKLIMPAIDNWKTLGAEGRQATQLLLNAVHGEMRRAIVTPSIGDRSTVLNGVWTHKGKVVAQSDLMAIPMQFLSYGLGAHNKTLTSMIQGRDRSPALGLFMTYLMAIGSLWLVTDKDQWRRKTYDQILMDSFDKSGIGGFWFNNLNSSLERATNDQLGIRPSLGIKPDFPDKTTADRIAGPLSLLGPAPSKFYDLSRAFWDSEITGSRRAQIIRRGIPYNNVMWWDGLITTMMKDVEDVVTGAK